jgi:hypothetical protein
MPNVLVLEQIELAELAQSVDDGRLAADPFKLPAALRTLLDTRLADLKAKDAATLLTEGGRATASANVRAALDQLTVLLRDGYNFVNALPSFSISPADKLGVFTAYGWESGLIGEFTDARVEALANQAITATPSIPNPAHAYPAALLTLITAQLAIVNANQPLATGGTAQAATAARDLALELLQTVNDRVRFWYCAASDDEDQTPELAKIGRQPRRASGEAQSQPLPSATGTATFDATALTLTIPAPPDHATSIRAFRKPAGGVAQLAGTSTTNVVSIVAAGPLTPGVTYELWLVGHNSQGDGPESNHITFAAP